MPELSRFFGIVIRMYFGDHQPPHFPASYGDERAVIAIETLEVLGGRLSPRAMGLVIEWATLKQAELRAAWNKAVNLELPESIEPLL